MKANIFIIIVVYSFIQVTIIFSKHSWIVVVKSGEYQKLNKRKQNNAFSSVYQKYNIYNVQLNNNNVHVAFKSSYSLNNIKLLLKSVLSMFMLAYCTTILSQIQFLLQYSGENSGLEIECIKIRSYAKKIKHYNTLNTKITTLII